MSNKAEQLARALVFSSTLAGVVAGNLWLGYKIGLYLQKMGYLAQGKVFGIVLGILGAVFSIYKTLRMNFLVKKDKTEYKNKKN